MKKKGGSRSNGGDGGDDGNVDEVLGCSLRPQRLESTTGNAEKKEEEMEEWGEEEDRKGEEEGTTVPTSSLVRMAAYGGEGRIHLI